MKQRQARFSYDSKRAYKYLEAKILSVEKTLRVVEEKRCLSPLLFARFLTRLIRLDIALVCGANV